MNLFLYSKGDVEIHKKDIAYSGYFRIDRYLLSHRKFDGDMSKPRTFELFERGQAVAVLPYDPRADKVVLVEQFRMGAVDSDNPWLLEVIAGIIEEGEHADEVARRESMEEAHCQLAALESIAQVYVSPGGSSESVQLFCAKTDVSKLSQYTAGLEEEGEDIRVHVVAFSQAMALLQQKKIKSAPAMMCLQWLQLNKYLIKEKWL